MSTLCYTASGLKWEHKSRALTPHWGTSDTFHRVSSTDSAQERESIRSALCQKNRSLSVYSLEFFTHAYSTHRWTRFSIRIVKKFPAESRFTALQTCESAPNVHLIKEPASESVPSRTIYFYKTFLVSAVLSGIRRTAVLCAAYFHTRSMFLHRNTLLNELTNTPHATA